MGSAAIAQPLSPTLKKQKSKTIVTIKQKEAEEPMKPLIAEVVAKEIDIPERVSSKALADIEQMQKAALREFQTRFLLKITRNEIRLVFKEQEGLKNISYLSSNSQLSPMKSLRKKCQHELQIFSQICRMKLKCFTTQKLKNIDYQKEEEVAKVKQSMGPQFRKIVGLLISQIEGKTSIWHSLNLKQKNMLTNLINFMHEQGVCSEMFQVFKQKSQIINS